MNSINIIIPYRYEGEWVFDDERVGLSRELFVSGADQVMDLISAHIPDAHSGFRLTFAATPFPGYQHKFIWKRREFDGNWYYSDKLDKEGWLCPALFKYFETAPAEIFVKVEARSPNSKPA
jgi:hypothetical protein